MKVLETPPSFLPLLPKLAIFAHNQSTCQSIVKAYLLLPDYWLIKLNHHSNAARHPTRYFVRFTLKVCRENVRPYTNPHPFVIEKGHRWIPRWGISLWYSYLIPCHDTMHVPYLSFVSELSPTCSLISTHLMLVWCSVVSLSWPYMPYLTLKSLVANSGVLSLVNIKSSGHWWPWQVTDLGLSVCEHGTLFSSSSAPLPEDVTLHSQEFWEKKMDINKNTWLIE